MNEPAPQDSIGREETIFNAAVQLRDPARRALYLDWACEGDAVLRRRLEKLLAADSDDALSKRPVVRIALAEPTASAPGGVTGQSETESVGNRIGRYKLLQKIGEGGCGVVYMAEQEEPVRRRVALKIIKLGMDTKSVIARFEAERQALALMDHPNIAKVHDAGATETGRPYFVMELVRGVKITDYCDEKSLTTRKRLELFSQVCHAVQHAHQKGIIHRDIKPSNILVSVNDGVAVPKVIDFGIAKATTDQRLTDKTVFTAFEQFIGTPAYMSPEQAEITSVDVDTRSDIYSLGVLLYELLTSKTPFDARELLQAGLDEMRRTIREKEPERPSTRVSTLAVEELTTTAKRRGLEPPKLVGMLRGDLDWIAMKCLEKDRARRYETANGLAMDIQRHLMNEPVVACPPSRLYRFRKLVRRNKVGFFAAGAVGLSLLVGLGFSTWMYYQELGLRHEAETARNKEAQQQTAAEKEATKSQEVARFLKEMLQGVGPSKALGRDTTMLREILDKTAERVGRELTNQPEAEIEMRLALADTYCELALYKQMEAMGRESLRLARSIAGGENETVAWALARVGTALHYQGDLEGAETMLRDTLAIERKLRGNERSEVALSINNVANVLMDRGKLAEAEGMYREALAIQTKQHGNEHLDVALSLCNLGSALYMRGELPEAETMFRQSLETRRRLLGNEHPLVANSLDCLANVLHARGKLVEAEEMFRETLAMQKRLLGNEHPDVALSINNLVTVLFARGKLGEAEELSRQALAIQRKALGNEHRVVAISLLNLAMVLQQQKKLAEAEDLCRQALEMQRKLLGNEHPNVLTSLNNLAGLLSARGKLAEAEAMQREVLAIRRKQLGDEHPDVAASLNNLGVTLQRQDKLVEAEEVFERVVAMRGKLLGNDHPDSAKALYNLGFVRDGRGKLSEAESALREALAVQRKLLGDEHPDVATTVAVLANTLIREHKPDEAEELYAQLLASADADQTNGTWLLKQRGEFYARCCRWKEAAADLGHALELAPDDHLVWHSLAAVLVQADDLASYREHCQRSLERFGNTTEPRIAHRTSKDCLILPAAVSNLALAGKMADFAFDATPPDDSGRHWIEVGKALAQYRLGKFPAAADWAQKGLTAAGTNWNSHLEGQAVLAMAQYQLKQADQARATLSHALEIADAKLPKIESGDLGYSWLDWIIAQALLREAKELLAVSAATTNTSAPAFRDGAPGPH